PQLPAKSRPDKPDRANPRQTLKSCSEVAPKNLRTFLGSPPARGIRQAATAPVAVGRGRKLVAATLRYLLSATSWHYYRTVLGFTMEESIDAVTLAFRQALDDLSQ